MTDSFQYTDGWNYRYRGIFPGGTVGLGGEFLELFTLDGIGNMVPLEPGRHLPPVATFERVEPALWPWTGPSGRKYAYDHYGGWVYISMGDERMNSIDHKDFAGLAERLAKQAQTQW